MLALLGQRLASAGVLFVLPDLYGTGDSDGDFEESTWEQWTSNIRSVTEALADYGIARLDVLALRSGVFLIPGLDGSDFPSPEKVVMWSPVQRGAKMIDQILRSKVIKDSTSTDSASVATVRNEIRRAGDMEVAGYRMTNNLVASIDGLELSRLRLPRNSAVHWIDVSPVTTDRIPPSVEETKSAWQDRVKAVSYSRVIGPQFWMGPEIDLVPDLLTQTAEILISD
jgi:exosortase A-associated hydrolase 2